MSPRAHAFDRFYDQPVINDRVLALADLITTNLDLIDDSLILSTELDDEIVDDHRFTREPKHWSSSRVTATERQIWTALAELTEPERVTVLRIVEGTLSRSGEEIDEPEAGGYKRWYHH